MPQWEETIAPDEDQRFELYAKRLATLQHAAGGKYRALHAKAHGVYSASFEVGTVPDEARHGLFAKPATYEALVRFSNGASRLQRDKANDVRGIAVKVLGVPGTKVLGGGTTQDFLAILSPATPFVDADEFMRTVWATRSPPLALFRLIGALGPIRPFKIIGRVMKGFKAPAASLTTKRFFSASTITCGPHAVRFAFTPIEPLAGELGTGADHFGDDLAQRLAKSPAAYAMQLQFFRDAKTTPIEDHSVEWDAPFVDVAKLTIAKQDAASERGKLLRERGEALAFDPWHALVEHKPIGNIMRARKVAYFASQQARGVAPEPTSIAGLIG